MKEPNMIVKACRFWDRKKNICTILVVDDKTGCYKGRRCPFKKLLRGSVEGR